jgi:hypothetical protein
VCVSCLQGFLNVCIYVWSDQHMRLWLTKHFFFWRNQTDVSDDYVLRDDDDASSSHCSQTLSNSLSYGIGDSATSPLSFTNLRDSVAINTSSGIQIKPSKSILVPQATQSKNSDSGFALSVDLDHDRFVRFGE